MLMVFCLASSVYVSLQNVGLVFLALSYMQPVIQAVQMSVSSCHHAIRHVLLEALQVQLCPYTAAKWPSMRNTPMSYSTHHSA